MGITSAVHLTGAEAFIDLARHARAIAGISDWARVGVRAASYENVARAVSNESKVIRNVLAAAEQHPEAFTGARDVAEGARLLRRAHELMVGTLAPLNDQAPAMYTDLLGRSVRDTSAIAHDLQRASVYVHDGFSALGGRRALPVFETLDEAAARGFDVSTLRAIDDANPSWVKPATDPLVRARGHRVTQFFLRNTILRPINLFAAAKTVPGHELAVQGAAIIAPMHGSLLDPIAVATAYPKALRLMGNKKLFAGPLKWLFTRAGGFPVEHGNAVEGLATGRGILRAGGQLEMYPEGMLVRHQSIGSHATGPARLALETGADVHPLAIYGLKPGKFRGERGRRRLASIAAGAVVRPGGAPATDRNITLMQEHIARSTDEALPIAKQHYDARRAASLGRKRWYVYGGSTAGAGLGVRELVD